MKKIIDILKEVIIMLFEKKFDVIEIYESGVRVTNYLRGSRKAVNKDIEMYKQKSKEYQLIGKNAMIVWA